MPALSKFPFKPKLAYYEVEWFAGKRRMGEKKIENAVLYDLVRKLTEKAYPSQEDKYDRKWFNFYLPLRRRGYLISLPFWIVEYNKEFFIGFQGLGNLHITKGTERIEKEYKAIFRETSRFVPIIKKTRNKILEKTIPYDIRTGKIKGKYVMEKFMPEREKEKILGDYGNHLEKKLEISEISLNDYLKVCAICYRAAFGRKTEGLSPVEMYRKWADGRDCGMLEIEDKDSKSEFMDWRRNKSHCGGHPFEIIFSWIDHGVHLYPPDPSYAYHYSLYVTNYSYAEAFVRMVNALIKEGVPFDAKELREVLNYLAGETHLSVNSHGDIFHTFFYEHSSEYKKKYFKRIEWDKIEVPAWKSGGDKNGEGS